MYGYIQPNQDELRIREYTEYRAYYCGLCKCLSAEYGEIARSVLSYDCTFIALLLSGLAGTDDVQKRRCVYKPLSKPRLAAAADHRRRGRVRRRFGHPAADGRRLGGAGGHGHLRRPPGPPAGARRPHTLVPRSRRHLGCRAVRGLPSVAQPHRCPTKGAASATTLGACVCEAPSRRRSPKP